MNKDTINLLCKQFDLDEKVIKYVNSKEHMIDPYIKRLEEIREFNQYKVIQAMHNSKLSSTDFNWTTGYGYGDVGREKVEEIFANVFKGEDALVRPSIASGTHGLSLTLSGLLRPGDHLLSFTGTPYDTLQQVIGSTGNEPGNLMEFGIQYTESQLNQDNSINIENGLKLIQANTKIVMLQRSTGYSSRRAFTIDELESAISAIKNYNEDIIVMVDNCYGEFLDTREPLEAGADVMVGSLIKNPGGGLALSGGYIVSSKEIVELIANRLTAPGLGKDTGLTFGTTRTTLQGLFLAPHIVTEAVKGSYLVGAVYSSLGFNIVPKLDEIRSDIVQAIEFKSRDRLAEFCRGIQEASLVDAHFTPTAWDMPGYEDLVIMAAGGFIEGSSIELSADGPMREPFFAYYQGGLTYDHCKLGLMKSLDNLYKKNLVDLN